MLIELVSKTYMLELLQLFMLVMMCNIIIKVRAKMYCRTKVVTLSSDVYRNIKLTLILNKS